MEHVARAVHGRVGPDFRLNRPPLLATTSPETRQPGKAQDHSLNWVLGSQPEVVMAASGRNSEGKSRLCKKSLAERFMKVCSLPAGIKSAKTDLANLSLTQICNLRYPLFFSDTLSLSVSSSCSGTMRSSPWRWRT